MQILIPANWFTTATGEISFDSRIFRRVMNVSTFSRRFSQIIHGNSDLCKLLGDFVSNRVLFGNMRLSNAKEL